MNDTLAREITAFADALREPRSYQGAFTFVLFALHNRVRVNLWYNDRLEDIIEEYAPWALAYISTEMQFEGIACRTAEGGVLYVPEGRREINHWVAGLNEANSHGNGEHEDEDMTTFCAIYISLDHKSSVMC